MLKALAAGERLLIEMEARAYERKERHRRLRTVESRVWCHVGGYWRTSEKVVGVASKKHKPVRVKR